MHTCPIIGESGPHIGGPLGPVGSPNVNIGGMPAARAGDMAVCTGPPDQIATGSFSVFINGQPAARMGDPTVHGGVIVQGFPLVNIG